MKNRITNAAEISVLNLIDNTGIAINGDSISIGATVVVASKGEPFKVIRVTRDTWQDIFGKPLPKKNEFAEGLRHLADAARDCEYVNVVRVIPDDARFPLLTYHTSASEHGVVSSAVAFGSQPSIADADVILQVWPVDGDPSSNRSVKIEGVQNRGPWAWGQKVGEVYFPTNYSVNDVVLGSSGGRYICIQNHTVNEDIGTGIYSPALEIGAYWQHYNGELDNRLRISFYESDGEDAYLLESWLVGLRVNDIDAMGRPAFIETVLEQRSKRFRCNFNETIDLDAVWSNVVSALCGDFTLFQGGTDGAFADDAAKTAAFIRGWDLFRNEEYAAYLMFAAGNYNASVLANCIEIANLRHVSFFFDAPPAMTPDNAVSWVRELGLESRQAACYYSPLAADDQYYGGKSVWGVSGEVAAACARGDANASGATPGVHYAPAGSNRGKLRRTGIRRYNENIINRDDFYSARINPVIANTVTGGAVIDDCLSLSYKENYSRFIWVNRIANYIDHHFVEAAAYIKFEPDGLTRRGLYSATKSILDSLVVSGALSSPRTPEGGDAPYVISVEQAEIDLWLVTWDFCPTGAARRIAGQPRLIK